MEILNQLTLFIFRSLLLQFLHAQQRRRCDKMSFENEKMQAQLCSVLFAE
jgi:hypothetical protein